MPAVHMFSRKTRIPIPFNGEYIVKRELQLVRTNYSRKFQVQFSMSIVCESNGERFAIPINIILNPDVFNMDECPEVYLCDDACICAASLQRRCYQQRELCIRGSQEQSHHHDIHA